MRGRILMYLFIFTLMFTIFIYVNDKKILDAQTMEITRLDNQLSEVQNELDSLENINGEGEYFTLTGNEDAISYFEERGISEEEVSVAIQDKLINSNSAEEDNPFVPYEGMQGEMRINKIKVLNHKWAIADFTDGTYWGEVFFSYTVDENGQIELTPEKSFLYPVN
ncbi:hypothetical protein [Autumnicola musiva]|uniref:Hydrolase n=1 Tax=Autumnicola musiva TaxID=3075589 RepID=A0ABU3D5L7_9FLAO|nr:hypothetical protein [Zunongwangia sp. F117]MDT0676829.1 hypothetical protein [Zunongwangia sp. F117]